MTLEERIEYAKYRINSARKSFDAAKVLPKMNIGIPLSTDCITLHSMLSMHYWF